MSEPDQEERPFPLMCEGAYDADQAVKAAKGALERGDQKAAIEHLMEAIGHLSDEAESHAERIDTIEVNGAPI